MIFFRRLFAVELLSPYISGEAKLVMDRYNLASTFRRGDEGIYDVSLSCIFSIIIEDWDYGGTGLADWYYPIGAIILFHFYITISDLEFS